MLSIKTMVQLNICKEYVNGFQQLLKTLNLK